MKYSNTIFSAIAVVLFGVATVSVAELSESAMEENSGINVKLKELLKYGFDLDLEIAGGYGGSRDDPIVLLQENKSEASMTEMLVLRGVGRMHQLLWRTIEKNIVKHKGSLLEQVKINTKQVTDDEIISRRSNYYFDIGKSAGEEGLPLAIAYSDHENRVVLPYEIGWLHYDSVIDNELEAPGLGQSIAYGAPGVKATIYVYDKKVRSIPEDIGSHILVKEFESSVADLYEYNSDVESSGDVQLSEHMFYQVFEFSDRFSILSLTSVKGKFIKLRVTFQNDSSLIEIVNDSIDAFHQIVADMRG